MKNPTILGAICGDVIGSPYEGRRHQTKNYNFELYTPYSHFTDDTLLTVAVADWLLGENHSAALLTEIILKYVRKYPHSGFGRGFRSWVYSDNHEPYNSWGNGSAMRVSAVGYYFDTLEEVLEMAKCSAEVTHNHPEGIKGAQAAATAIFLARNGKTKAEIRDYIEQTFGYDLHRKYEEIKSTYFFHSSCQESVPESIVCFLESNNYEDAIRKAISLGGDADTMAAIAGGIAAAFYGEIPDKIYNFAMKKLPADLKAVVENFEGKISSQTL